MVFRRTDLLLFEAVDPEAEEFIPHHGLPGAGQMGSTPTGVYERLAGGLRCCSIGRAVTVRMPCGGSPPWPRGGPSSPTSGAGWYATTPWTDGSPRWSST